jgi:uncharacterized membrane protein YgdD (TMEM256/DUF423 family)
MDRLWIGLGALAGLGAVAMAAVGAHGGFDAARLGMLHDAVQMQGWHALALVGVGLWGARGGRWTNFAGLAFTLGLLIFCGAVYALVFRGPHVNAVAPFGGFLLMLGWALLFVSVLRARR